MPYSITDLVNSFSNFLSEKKINLKNNPNNFLISYAASIDQQTIILEPHSIPAKFSKSFYLEKPAENFSFAGIDEAISISEKGEGRFAAAEKKMNEWKNNFINNWEVIGGKRIPLFVGSFKFMVEHSDDDWKNFDDCDLSVPEIVYLKIENNFYLIYNFIFSGASSLNKATDKFKTKIESLFEKVNEPAKKGINFSLIAETGSSPKDKKKWKQIIQQALDKIEDGEIEKVVISRKVEYALSDEPDINKFILDLKKQYPHCYVFVINKNKTFFFGAAPEKLANFINGKIEIDALAGSAQRGSNEDEDKKIENELLKNNKDLIEHNFVVNHIKKIISNFTKDEIKLSTPSIRKLANIQHLITKFSVKINEGSSILSIIKELFPTPAVCGMPTTEALHVIKKLETHNRGLYSGIIGWLNFDGEGEFAVAIRSATLNKKKLTAYAGCGIVKGSNPDLEFAETELKLKTIRNLLNDEIKNK